MSEISLEKAIERDASALAEKKNDAADAVTLAAGRIQAVIEAASNPALTAVNDQIAALRELGRMIERRGEALADAAAEHAQFCADVRTSQAIMATAIDSLHQSFANGLPPSLRLVK